MWFDGWTPGRIYGALRRQPLLTGSVVVLLLAGAFSIAVGSALGLANFEDVGYPDSATLLRLKDFVHSGYIYPDINRPPYLVTLYGPLTYVILGIPYRLAQVAGVTPQLFVRLSIIGAICLDVLLIFLIVRRLHGPRPVAWLCALFAVSAFPMASWTTQIRGDFLALGLSLLSVYLFLFTNGRSRAVGGAICAGIALLFKQTFLAAPVAIIGWLIYKRRFKEAVYWATGCALTVVLGYAIAWWREPLMLQHITAIGRPTLEYRGAVSILWNALSQPVVPFAAIGGFLALRKRTPEGLLVLIYCVVAWLAAILTIPQVGGNINYFWEPLLASAVLAGPGLCELQRKASRTPILVTAMLFILLARSFIPVLRQDLVYVRNAYRYVSDYQLHKARWESLMSVVSGRRLLSTIPALTSQSTIPEMPDPFLNSVLERQGRWSARPVVARIDAGVYDLIVIGKGEAEDADGYRGVPIWGDGMWKAIKSAYALACVFENKEVWLPRNSSGEFFLKLSAIGCLPMAKQVDSSSVIPVTSSSSPK